MRIYKDKDGNVIKTETLTKPSTAGGARDSDGKLLNAAATDESPGAEDNEIAEENQ
ncbi:MAG: hypothetical protein ACRCV9_11585 [Burkholderiaceae bacterium]